MTDPREATYTPAPEPTVVARVWRMAVPADELVDECWTWESGQVYAAEGYRVEAVADDMSRFTGNPRMTVAEAQELYDYHRRIALDCFGKEWAK